MPTFAHRTPNGRSTWLIGALAAALALTVQARAFTLPDASDLGAHAALAVSDDPMAPPEHIDLGRVGDAAQAQADRFEAAHWTIDALAEQLGDDVWAAHAVLSRRIGTDGYQGVLRGAQGTLAARAGSAWDRALLLGALLDAMGHETRFALASLDPQHPALAPRGPAEPWDDPAITDVLAVDAEAVGRRARRDHAVVLAALADAATGSAVAPRAAPDQHVWVQVRDGDAWIDVDPGADPGETLTTAATHAGAPPEEALHRVSVRVLADLLIEDRVDRRTVLAADLVAWEAAERDLWLMFESVSGGGAAGVLAGVLAVDEWRPVLLGLEEPLGGEAFPLGAGSGAVGGFFGRSTNGQPELVTLTVELEASAPGATAQRATRVLFDRSPPGARDARGLTVDDLLPLPDDRSPAALGTLHQVLVSTGGASPFAYAIDRMVAMDLAAAYLADDDAATAFDLSDLLRPLATANAGLVVASERVIVDGMTSADVRAFVGLPRAFLVSIAPDDRVPGGTTRVVDLALDGIDVWGVDAAEAARHRTWYGALQTALETEDALRAAAAVDPDTLRVGSVSLALPGATLQVWTPADVATVPAEARELHAALIAGDLAVTVGEPTTFFALDPRTGALRSVMEPGIRPGFSGGGNYVNSVGGGGPRWIVDPRTGNTIGYERNGVEYRYRQGAPKSCRGGSEYTTLLGCVSIPSSLAAGVLVGSTIVAIVSWSSAIISLLSYVFE